MLCEYTCVRHDKEVLGGSFAFWYIIIYVITMDMNISLQKMSKMMNACRGEGQEKRTRPGGRGSGRKRGGGHHSKRAERVVHMPAGQKG